MHSTQKGIPHQWSTKGCSGGQVLPFPLEHMNSGSFPVALCSGGSCSLTLCPRESEKEHGGQPRVNSQWAWLPDNRMEEMWSEIYLLCLSISKRQQSEGGKIPWSKRKWDRQSLCIFMYHPDHFLQLELSWVLNLLHKSPCDFDLFCLCPSTAVSREPRATVTQGTWKQ